MNGQVWAFRGLLRGAGSPIGRWGELIAFSERLDLTLRYWRARAGE